MKMMQHLLLLTAAEIMMQHASQRIFGIYSTCVAFNRWLPTEAHGDDLESDTLARINGLGLSFMDSALQVSSEKFV